jgi:hypothetical protein
MPLVSEVRRSMSGSSEAGSSVAMLGGCSVSWVW